VETGVIAILNPRQTGTGGPSLPGSLAQNLNLGPTSDQAQSISLF